MELGNNFIGVISHPNCFFLIHVYLVYSLVSSCIILCNSQPPVSPSAIETTADKMALLSFKSLITEDPFGALTTWNNSIYVCQWQGVSCSTVIRSSMNSSSVASTQQRVTSLTLISMDLEGQISSSLSNLSFLISLNLAQNHLHGTIPPELGMLSQLRRLNLSTNSLGSHIPPSLWNCTNLEYVDLMQNELEGEIPKEFFTGLYGLKSFRASRNKLTGMVPPQLGNITSLMALSLSQNLLSGRIPIEIGQLSGLVFLDLDSNSLIGSIPHALYNLSSLRILGLANNHFTGTIPSGLGGALLPNIWFLNMYMNNLEGLLPPSLCNASNIHILDLSLNRLSGPIPPNFGSSMRSLNKLLLGGNHMLEAGDWSFLTSLVNCTQLKYIHIGSNKLEGKLPNSIGNFSTQLQELHLQGNQITGQIPSSIGYLTSLMMLRLESNNLSGVIPDTMGMLKGLLGLYMRSNDISGEIPIALNNLSLITDLDLSRNNIKGVIPVSMIQDMRSLQYIDLSHNNLTGSIIQLSSSLISVDLSYNSLTGLLPPNFSDTATNLNILTLSYNGLSGDIPLNSLVGFQVLQELRLDHNYFKGTIPTSFANLRGLQVLDVSGNQFSGTIPPDLGFLSLNYLNMSYNHLQGPVPVDGIFNKPSLLDIKGNIGLCGGTPMLHLPSCFPQDMNHRNDMKKKITWIIPISIASIIFIFIIGWMLRTSNTSSMKKKSSDGSSVTPMLSRSHRSEDNMFISTGGSCRSIIIHTNPLTREKTQRVWEGPLRISYMDTYKATCGFSRENLLGSGGFGYVYKGALSIGDNVFAEVNKIDVAIKVLHLDRKGADKSFESECSILRGIRHHNLVPVLTCCVGVDNDGNDFKALVYEFMPNGNLDDWIHPNMNNFMVGRKRYLSLLNRLDIAIDVASALEYLHLHCKSPIIHCDIKPSNILLDQDMIARIADFGLARLRPVFLGDTKLGANSTIELKGSYGYIAPEYGWRKEVSLVGDIYSFGILLLEMFTGKKPTDPLFFDDLSLHTYVELAFNQNILNIVDPNLCSMEEHLKRECSIDFVRRTTSSRFHECLKSILCVGLLCSKQDPKTRLGIEDAHKALKDAKADYVSVYMPE